MGARHLDEVDPCRLLADPLVARALWGLVWLAVSIGLSILTLPLTIIQLQVLFGFGARPVRLDYLVYLWALVPWLYRRPTRSTSCGLRRGAAGLRTLRERLTGGPGPSRPAQPPEVTPG